MNYRNEKKKDVFLFNTEIENIFINDYMVAAPGDYVKVYIYGAYYSQMEMSIDDEKLCRILSITPKQLSDAWSYWEKMGVVRRRILGEDREPVIEFINLKQSLFGMGNQISQKDEENLPTIMTDKVLKELFSHIESVLGRGLTSNEANKVISLLDEDLIAPEVIKLGVEYCKERGKTSLNYISSVLKGWKKDGLNTAEQINEALFMRDERYMAYRQILDYLGFKRNPSVPEKNLMDKWFDQLGLDISSILSACEKTVATGKPSLKYVDAILNSNSGASKNNGGNDAPKNQKGTITQKIMNEYYSFLRNKREEEQRRRSEEVYKKEPLIGEKDREIRDISMSITKALISKSDKSVIERLKQEREDLIIDRAVMMTENGFPMDYTEVPYKCSVCKDTGVTDDGATCSCYKERAEEAKSWQLSRDLI